MTSILRFDKWQNTLGQNYGTVLQVKTAKDSNTATSSSNSWSSQLGVPIVRRMEGSSFVITAHVYMGFTMSISGNADVDNYGVGIARDSTPLTIDTRGSNYIGTGFAGSDVPVTGSGTYGSTYDTAVKSVVITDTPSGAVGTTFTYNILFRSPTAAAGGIAYYNRSAANTNSGGTTTLCIMEVAPE